VFLFAVDETVSDLVGDHGEADLPDLTASVPGEQDSVGLQGELDGGWRGSSGPVFLRISVGRAESPPPRDLAQRPGKALRNGQNSVAGVVGSERMISSPASEAWKKA